MKRINALATDSAALEAALETAMGVPVEVTRVAPAVLGEELVTCTLRRHGICRFAATFAARNDVGQQTTCCCTVRNDGKLR